MKNVYLTLAIIGFILPNILVTMVSIDTGNILLYTNPLETVNGMFSNNISGAFMIDLLFTVLVFMLWSFKESKKYNIKFTWLVWASTFLFGLAGGFPLFLYLREAKLKNKVAQNQ